MQISQNICKKSVYAENDRNAMHKISRNISPKSKNYMAKTMTQLLK